MTDGLEALREMVAAFTNEARTAGSLAELDETRALFVEAIAEHYRPIIEAASRIAQFGAFAEAIAGDERPLKDSDVIVSVMGGGGSDVLRWQDLRELIEALS